MSRPRRFEPIPPLRRLGRRPIRWLVMLLGLLLTAMSARTSPAAEAEKRCVVLELYIRNNNAACRKAVETLQQFVKTRKGVQIRTYNLDEKGKHVDRFQRILKYFRVKDVKVPVVYGCRYLLSNVDDPETLRGQVESILTVTAYVRNGCPKCAAAKRFLNRIKPKYPCFRFVEYEVVQNQAALKRLEKLANRYGTKAVSLPGIHFCNELSIGYSGDATTGRRIESVLDYWTIPCEQLKEKDGNRKTDDDNGDRRSSLKHRPESSNGFGARNRTGAPVSHAPFHGGPSVPETSFVSLVASSGDGETENPDDSKPPSGAGALPDSPVPPKTGPKAGDGPIAPGPPPTDDLPPVPPGPQQSPSGEGDERPPPEPARRETMNVPVFGKLRLRDLGMPAFTFLVGLVDGFNPCAMWVLLFLLSVLVNLKSRAKILAVAGTFVVVSGLAYYAFMAAWLSVFLFIGYLRWVQITLGVVALVIGTIHIKDFFAFKTGVSLSIPESAKPTIYAKVRRIVMANSLMAAIAGATVLAVLVNIVELLCTAGLPAVYTQILTLQGYPAWKNYSYLGLYILAYMLDDMLMVGIVVVTLGRHKMQERHGQWLKLVSGIAIAVLGLLMIVKPEWLV